MPEHPLYPIFLNLEQRPVLIVGGGAVAARKAATLLHAGALVTVVSLAFHTEFNALTLKRILQPYNPTHMTLKPWRLVFAATNDASVNSQVAEDAGEHKIPFSRADLPDASDFVNGASVDKGSLTIAVSTGKASPVLAARIRDAALASIDPVLFTWTELMSQWRAAVLTRLQNPAARRDLLIRLSSPEMETILRRSTADAHAAFESWLAAVGGAPPSTGDSSNAS